MAVHQSAFKLPSYFIYCKELLRRRTTMSTNGLNVYIYNIYQYKTDKRPER